MKSSCLIALLALTSSLHAGTDAPKGPVLPPVQEESLWNFRFAPYGWVTAIEGDVRIGQLTAPIDISMKDTLDTLDMGFMGVLEASYAKWSFGVDFVYGKTSQDIDGGGLLFDSYYFEQKQWIITPEVAYRIIDKPGYRMDVMAGARVTVMESELTGRFANRHGEVSGVFDKSWVDPIIGLRGTWDFSDKWFFRYNGDIGGFGVSSDLNWQAFGGIGYNVNKLVSMALGYRAVGVDYDRGGFAMDSISHGPVIGFEMHW